MADMYQRLPQELTGPGGDQKELRVKYVDNGDGTWSLATTPMGVAAGAATSAKQDTTNLKLDDLIAAVNAMGGDVPLTKLIDDTTTANVTYIGETALTPAGVSESASSWRIKRIDESGSVTKIKYADGDSNFDNKWSDRATTVVYV